MLTKLLPYLASLIVMSAFAASYTFAVNYGKQKAQSQCETEKVQNTKDALTEDRATIKEREKADETVRNQDRSDFARDLSPEWVCGADCEI